MWLLPHQPWLSRWIAHSMHRITAVEGALDRSGPVLLVANHPNALIDPVVVTAAVGRPVRWLAKSTLVFQPWIGWLFRAAGAIPVYRRQDDASQMDRNSDTFDAAVRALGDGSVVALFPEGVSHAAPGLAPLKTGAARLALQAAATLGHSIPIVPVGVIYRDASIYRSPAGVVIGAPIPWEDLAGAGPSDRSAASELTDRISRALAGVTRQLDSWADQQVVEHAAAVVAATTVAGDAPPSWIARASGVHGVMEAADDPRLPPLRERLRRHAHALERLGLTPAQLAGQRHPPAGRWWRGWRAPLVALVWAVGLIWTWVPYRATGQVAGRLTRDRDLLATLKAVVGFVLFVVWILATALVLGVMTGWPWGVAAIPLGVALALGTLQLEEARQARAQADRAVRWRRRRSQQLDALTVEQSALADDLRALLPRIPPETRPAQG
jgi:1-acyl-sn-glycerol-3-phosphate acyltransferase